MYKVLYTLVLIVLPSFAMAQDSVIASLSQSSEQNVRQYYDDMERVLSDRMNYESVMKFFHEGVNDNASFMMSVENPSLSDAQKGQSFKMTKQDYINSFLIGSAGVRDYAVSVEPVQVQRVGDHVQSVSVLKERGYVENTSDVAALPQYFESSTVCHSRHKENEGSMQLVESACKTTIANESSI